MNAEYIQSLHHAAQDEEQYVEQLSVDEIQRLSAKKGPGLNFSVSGTGTKDQMSWKLKVSETNPVNTLVVNRIKIPSEKFLKKQLEKPFFTPLVNANNSQTLSHTYLFRNFSTKLDANWDATISAKP